VAPSAARSLRRASTRSLATPCSVEGPHPDPEHPADEEPGEPGRRRTRGRRGNPTPMAEAAVPAVRERPPRAWWGPSSRTWLRRRPQARAQTEPGLVDG
jgi:hypothetical protein